MRRAVLIAVAVVYSVAAFPAAIAPASPGAPDPALLTVPFCAGFAVAFVPLGWLADRVGRAVLLSGSLLGVVAGGILLAAAADADQLAGARALQGIAAAGLPPAAQALLAQAGGNGRAGRAISSMMAAVAVGTLAGPLLAGAAVGAAGWRPVTLLLGVLLPGAAAALVLAVVPRPTRSRTAAGDAWPAGGSVAANRPLLAGCAVAALVLAGYWTLLTRLETILDGAASGSGARLVAVAAGIAGIALVVVAGRAVDRSGPRRPMLHILALGAAAAAVAAAVDHPAAVILGIGMVLALYWSYLPVVSVQVARSAPEAARATALGLLYSSMWLGAALGGAVAAVLPDGQAVVTGVAVAWALALAVAAAGFHRAPEVAA